MTTRQRLHLFKRSNGIWYVGYIKDGRRHWKTTKCKNKGEALAFLKSFNPIEEAQTPVLRLSELFTELSNSKTLRENTISIYSVAVNRLTDLCGDKVLGGYRSDDLIRFKNDLLSKNVSPTSVNIWIRALVAVFSYGVKRGYISRNPFSTSMAVKIAKQPPVFMSQEEFEQLIGCVTNPTLRDFFVVAGNTGMRLGEMLNLKWADVSLEKKQIAVVNSDEFVTKNGKSRVIPMHDRVVEVMTRRASERSSGEYVFCKPNGFRLNKNYIDHEFKKYIRKAKLSEKYHFHTLRHSFASWLALKEVPIFSIQQLLGHSSVTTTLVYAHLSSSVLHSAVNKI